MSTAGVLALTASAVRANFSQNFNTDPSLTGGVSGSSGYYVGGTSFDDGLVAAGFNHTAFTGNAGSGNPFTSSTNVVAGIGAGGAGDNAVAQIVADQDLATAYWYSGFWFDTTLDANVLASQNLADISIFADVKAPTGAVYAIKVEWGNGPYGGGGAWEFLGTGTGNWQSIGGPLNLATPHFANPSGNVFNFGQNNEVNGGYTFVAAYRDEQATWGTGGTLLVDNINVVGMTNFGIAPPPVLGDYNDNGVVDAADYVVWRNGDSPDDSQAGYNLWKANFGSPPGSGSGLGSGAVPEPNSLVLVGLALLAAGHRCLKRSKSSKFPSIGTIV
jgi:hypothetical protein